MLAIASINVRTEPAHVALSRFELNGPSNQLNIQWNSHIYAQSNIYQKSTLFICILLGVDSEKSNAKIPIAGHDNNDIWFENGFSEKVSDGSLLSEIN